MNARLTATLRRLVVSCALGLGLVLALITFVSAPSLAAPGLRRDLAPGNPVVMPRANSHTASRNTTVAITYSEAISVATVNTRTFAVHAMQTGQLTRSFGVLGGSIVLTPARPFKPGELVQASATTRTLNLAGQGPVSPTVWQFRVAAGAGPGIFLDSGQRMGLSFTLGAALGDLNGDGYLDAFVTNNDQGDQVWLNNGAGVLIDSGQILPGISSRAVALGDLNGDGNLDAIVGSRFDVTGTIWLNNGSGLFTSSGQTLIFSETSAIALGDLNGDGALDVFVGNPDSYDFACLPDPCPLGGGSQVWLNNGSGFLTDSGQVLGFGSNNVSVALGDVNGDGNLDALVGNQATQWSSGNWGGGETSVWLNNGGGVFTLMTPTLGLTSTTRAVAMGDLNGDGDLDALVGNFGPTLVYFNNGAGVFTNTGQTLGISATLAVALGDVDGDGDLDALIGNDTQPKTIWLNNGFGFFTDSGQALTAEATTSVALGDLDGDGDLDTFVGNGGEGEPNTIWFNTNEFTAQDDQFTILEDHPANVLNVLTNDHTPTGTLTILNVGVPNHGGSVAINAATIIYTPAVDYNGLEGFTYTVRNTAGLTAIARVTTTILTVNDPPSFSKGTDRIVSEDAGPQVVTGWATNIRSGPVTALDEAGQSLVFTLTSNNAALFAGPLQLNTAGTLTYTPAANAFGSALVLAALRDNGGTLNGGVDNFSATFHITVTAVNDPPTLNPIGDRVISGSLQTQVITLTGISAGPNETEPVIVTAISTNTAVLPQPTVVYTSPNTTGLLQITPSAGQSGTANVIVTVSDGMAQTSRTFRVTVNPSFFVVATDPFGSNQIIQPTQSITATFNVPLNASTVNTRTFQVYGQQTGVYQGSYTIGSTFVRFTPTGGFQPGEAIAVHLSDALKASDGRSLIPYTWRFRVAVPSGLGLFVDSGQSLTAPNQPLSGRRPLGPQSALDSQAVALGDLNGDGDLDLFVGRNAITSTVWFNDRKGNFTLSSQPLFKSNVWAVAVGDVNGNGTLDAYIANYNAPDQIWLNNGAGIFSDSGQRLGTADSYAVLLGDVDGDGDLDALVGTGLAQANVVWLNNGSGVFTDSGQRLGYGASRAVALGDVNGDGSLDAVIGEANGLGSKVWLNNGAGQFAATGQSLGNGHVYGLALGDINGDGDLDMLLGDVNGTGNTVWLNNGSGSFGDSGQHLGSAATWAVSLSDVDGDGDLDAFFGNITLGAGTSSNQVWLNNGSGLFSDSGQRLGTASTFAVAIGDVDRDGDLDAFAGNNNSLGQANQLWLNRPNAPHARADLFFVPRDSVNTSLNVLANDVYPDVGALSVSAIGQPAKGTASFSSAAINYRPTVGITGTDTFTYTVRGANNRTDTAQVTVLIFEQVQTVVVSSTQGGSLVHTDDQGSTTIVNIPAGAISQTLEFRYTPITTQTHPTTGTLQFAGHSFQIEAYQGGQLVPGVVFAQPITITIHYDSTDVSTLNPSTLELRYWNGSAWVSDGITLVTHDLSQRWIMLRVTHLSEFALLGEQGWRLYLPLVRR